MSFKQHIIPRSAIEVDASSLAEGDYQNRATHLHQKSAAATITKHKGREAGLIPSRKRQLERTETSAARTNWSRSPIAARRND